MWVNLRHLTGGGNGGRIDLSVPFLRQIERQQSFTGVLFVEENYFNLLPNITILFIKGLF